MLRASFSAEIGGRRVLFAMPLAALRKVAQIDPKLFAVAERLSRRECTLDEVVGVLAAATDDEIARHIIEEAGLMMASVYALQILSLALTDDPSPEAGPPKATTE